MNLLNVPIQRLFSIYFFHLPFYLIHFRHFLNFYVQPLIQSLYYPEKYSNIILFTFKYLKIPKENKIVVKLKTGKTRLADPIK